MSLLDRPPTICDPPCRATQQPRESRALSMTPKCPRTSPSITPTPRRASYANATQSSSTTSSDWPTPRRRMPCTSSGSGVRRSGRTKIVTSKSSVSIADWFDVLDDHNLPVLTEREVVHNPVERRYPQFTQKCCLALVVLWSNPPVMHSGVDETSDASLEMSPQRAPHALSSSRYPIVANASGHDSLDEQDA
ncbi:hypothetical protein BDZ97DRAFT_1916956 [Flammula alnicola]|nr:hypothetical protein BDZ97DRAFT_1916956 [Flammula alnicola]